MPDRVKEKLVEIIQNSVGGCARHWAEVIADGLIANGVTVRNEPIKIVIPGDIDEKVLMETIRNSHMQILPGETLQEWISVKDRLPEDNERVLVYHDDGVIRFGINKCGFADVVSTLYLKHNHRTCFSKVTHWIPLPQPPKGE